MSWQISVGEQHTELLTVKVEFCVCILSTNLKYTKHTSERTPTHREWGKREWGVENMEKKFWKVTVNLFLIISSKPFPRLKPIYASMWNVFEIFRPNRLRPKIDWLYCCYTIILLVYQRGSWIFTFAHTYRTIQLVKFLTFSFHRP